MKSFLLTMMPWPLVAENAEINSSVSMSLIFASPPVVRMWITLFNFPLALSPSVISTITGSSSP